VRYELIASARRRDDVEPGRVLRSGRYLDASIGTLTHMSLSTSNEPRGGREVFWGEIAPGDHLVQIYDRNDALTDSLEEFVGGGLNAGEAVIIIATPPNLRALEDRLVARGFDLNAARATDQFQALDAEETLAKFMRHGWPDDVLFNQCVRDILEKARRGGRCVRAFGEMVALLWARGDCAATVRLEHLWTALQKEQSFSLFCAYPKVGFTGDARASMDEICAAHTRTYGG
jgi:hypothetical protein